MLVPGLRAPVQHHCGIGQKSRRVSGRCLPSDGGIDLTMEYNVPTTSIAER
jgi:hypothetical protein